MVANSSAGAYFKAPTAMYWVPEEGRRKRGRHGEVHSKKTWKRGVSAGTEPAGSPVTETDEDFSSPNAPRGTGRVKS